MKFILLYILLLSGNELFANDTTSKVCYTIDRSIHKWRELDTTETSVENIQEENIVLSYPNPSNSGIKFLIQSKNLIINDITVVDFNGSIIKKFDVERINNNNTIFWDTYSDDNKPIPNGTYFLRIELDKKSIIHKFILSK
jgi:hypothetical protein